MPIPDSPRPHPGPIAPVDAGQAAADGVAIRHVATLAEYQECVLIQEETWGANFRERVPAAILMVAQRLGGVCAAAFAPDDRMLGFVFGITGPKDGTLVHWSDMLAVRTEARGRHVGERLKHYQRDLVRALGVRTMFWTFDPLVARNAHLNLVRLRATALEYVTNMYGDNTGSPLHGALDTDRLVAAWDVERDAGEVPDPAPRPEGTFAITTARDGDLPGSVSLHDAPVARIAVPFDLESLPLAARITWRNATRRAFTHYLTRGYRVIGFQRARDGKSPYYELAR